MPPPQIVPASSSHYTRVELANAHFVHSLALIEHIVCAKQARQMLFPLTTHHDRQSEIDDLHTSLLYLLFSVVVKDMLRAIIQIMLADQSGSKDARELG